MTRKISIKIIASISYLKKEDLLHCDIKPENILLDTNYNPLLIDFGYSQFFRENFNQ
jgi:serine/threonine protein kinase